MYYDRRDEYLEDAIVDDRMTESGLGQMFWDASRTNVYNPFGASFTPGKGALAPEYRQMFAVAGGKAGQAAKKAQQANEEVARNQAAWEKQQAAQQPAQRQPAQQPAQRQPAQQPAQRQPAQQPAQRQPAQQSAQRQPAQQAGNPLLDILKKASSAAPKTTPSAAPKTTPDDMGDEESRATFVGSQTTTPYEEFADKPVFIVSRTKPTPTPPRVPTPAPQVVSTYVPPVVKKPTPIKRPAPVTPIQKTVTKIVESLAKPKTSCLISREVLDRYNHARGYPTQERIDAAVVAIDTEIERFNNLVKQTKVPCTEQWITLDRMKDFLRQLGYGKAPTEKQVPPIDPSMIAPKKTLADRMREIADAEKKNKLKEQLTSLVKQREELKELQAIDEQNYQRQLEEARKKEAAAKYWRGEDIITVKELATEDYTGKIKKLDVAIGHAIKGFKGPPAPLIVGVGRQIASDVGQTTAALKVAAVTASAASRVSKPVGPPVKSWTEWPFFKPVQETSESIKAGLETGAGLVKEKGEGLKESVAKTATRVGVNLMTPPSFKQLIPSVRDVSSVDVPPGTDDDNATSRQWLMIRNARSMGEDALKFGVIESHGPTALKGQEREFIVRLIATPEFKQAKMLAAEASNRSEGAYANVQAAKKLAPLLEKLNETKVQIAVDVAGFKGFKGPPTPLLVGVGRQILPVAALENAVALKVAQITASAASEVSKPKSWTEWPFLREVKTAGKTIIESVETGAELAKKVGEEVKEAVVKTVTRVGVNLMTPLSFKQLIPSPRDVSSVEVPSGTDDYSATPKQWEMIRNARRMGDDTLKLGLIETLGPSAVQGEARDFLVRLIATPEFKQAKILGSEAGNRLHGPYANVEAAKQLVPVLEKLNEVKMQIAREMAEGTVLPAKDTSESERDQIQSEIKRLQKEMDRRSFDEDLVFENEQKIRELKRELKNIKTPLPKVGVNFPMEEEGFLSEKELTKKYGVLLPPPRDVAEWGVALPPPRILPGAVTKLEPLRAEVVTIPEEQEIYSREEYWLADQMAKGKDVEVAASDYLGSQGIAPTPQAMQFLKYKLSPLQKEIRAGGFEPEPVVGLKTKKF